MTPRFRASIVALAVVAGGSSLAFAKGYPMVGGAQMYPTKTIVENAVNSADHTTLVAAVKAAGLVETLSGPGPFTVLAPTNAAFAKLPAGTVDTLVKPENKATLTGILTYHVIPGKISAKMIASNAMKHGGKASYATVNGGTVTFMKSGKGWGVMDAKGGMAKITIADVNQSNGVIHVIDTVLMP
ncbi:fasciclin domain-containing protein [Sphingomonas hylomeconis]|uniref:Fasciclin domain-containing protein n=1 Tax=Sphingomonas hylomeconis TaxID=1395958 RepID=A0ABV7SPH6_9SPHN|nr:fasciclin domain-containing protein [Sphingomonas hylomeconis]